MVMLPEPELDLENDLLNQLNDSQLDRLTNELDRVLIALEKGESVDVEEFGVMNPDLQEVFVDYLKKLNSLFGVAVGFQNSACADEKIPAGLKQLGEFSLIREIGRGGMGVVYEAHQQSLDRNVAIKLLPMCSLLDQRQIARFKNEAHAAGLLQHPHIVPVHSVGTEGGIHFYAMQLIQGISIDRWINNRHASLDLSNAHQSQTESLRGQDWRTIVGWIVEIAEAIHAAHEQGVVHRDVKPSNLLLDNSGKVWITDFGLARCQNERSLTLSGEVVGTIRYMSPEQASGKNETVDHRTDIYSLAATLFEMLSLRPAIVGEDGPSLLNEILKNDPPRLTDCYTLAPRELSIVLQKAMAKQKDERYESAKQFASDLRAVLIGIPTIAKPPTSVQWAMKWVLRHGRSVTVATIFLVFFSIGTTVSSLMLRHQVNETRVAEQRADRLFHEGHSTVQKLGTNVAEQLASIPGAEHLRQSLLSQTLAYYEQFASIAKNDPKLQVEVAVTYSQIGSLIKELNSSVEAIPHYREAATLFALLPDTGPNETTSKVAENHNLLALALADTGQHHEAISQFENALKIQRSILDSEPDNIRYATELAVTTNNLGLLLQSLGRGHDATVALESAVTHLESLVQSQPDNELAARGLSAALTNLASISLESKPLISIDLLQRSLSSRLASIAKASNRLRASSELAAIYNSLGAAHLRAKQFPQSESSFTNAIRLLRQLHSIAPAVKHFKYDLAMCLNNLSIAQQKQGDHVQAIESSTEAINCIDSNGSNPPSFENLQQLAATQHNLATSCLALRQYDRAEHALRSAVELELSAHSQLPKDQRVSTTQLLMRHYSDLLRCQVRAGHWHDLDQTAIAYRKFAGNDSRVLAQVNRELTEVERLRPRQQKLSFTSGLTMQQAVRP